MQKRMRVFISGRVQGVSFRAYTKRRAEELGLSGWVRNLADGRVETVFEGSEKDVETMIEWCRSDGSPASQVSTVDVRKESVTDGLNGFTILKE